MIQGVLGPIPPAELGITLTHEHLFLDARPSWRSPTEASRKALALRPVTPDLLNALRNDPFMNLDNCSLFDEDVAVEEASRFRDAGGRTIVDATCRGIGRDPHALQRVARRTGLNVVMGTGFYLERTHPPYVAGASVSELAAIMIADLVDGDEQTGVRAGYIGEIGTGPAFTPQERKVLAASARAQAETGVALSVHLHAWGRHGHAVLDIVAENGGDIERTILDHMNPSWWDVDYQQSLADRGAYLAYDMIGLDYYFGPDDLQAPSDEESARGIVGLIERGHLRRLLLSHDVFLKMMLVRHGGNGYAYLLDHFVPRLRRHGVGDAQIDTLLVSNPAQILAVPA
ncbi:MAG: phosphotriesterase-related protein [Trueperaceae bacterium]|nr:phosphotriesterase-related protein [Trueperaceae bacterium]